MCLHGEVSSGVPIVGGASFFIRVRVEPTRNTKNAAQPSRKSSHPYSHNRTDVQRGVEFLISVVNVSSLISEYKLGV